MATEGGVVEGAVIFGSAVADFGCFGGKVSPALRDGGLSGLFDALEVTFSGTLISLFG